MKQLLGTAALLIAAPAAGQRLEAVSPDGASRMVVALDRQGVSNYTVQRRGELILAPAPIALDLDRNMLAYTRGLLGPRDYTPGGFRNVAPADFRMRGDVPMVQSTRAHGLAVYVVHLSPLQAVADSPDTYAASPVGFDFIRQVPTSWDEPRFVAGETGAYIVLARRKGRTWYVGAMNDETARTVSVPLHFLKTRGADAPIWSDGAVPDAV